MSNRNDTSLASLSDRWKVAIWMAFVTAASVVFSLGLACAMPFAAIAAIAAMTLSRRNVFLLVGIAFLINQAIGFLLLHYPTTPETFGWGAAIGVAAFAAAFVASEAMRKIDFVPAAGAMGFVGGFVVYELVLIASTVVLPSEGGFTLSVIGQILWINVLAFTGLLAFRWLGRSIGLLSFGGGPVAAIR